MNYKCNRYKDISFSHLKLKNLEKKKSLDLIELKLSQTKRGKKKDSTQLETQPLQGQHSNKIKVLKIKYHPLIPSLVNKKNEPKNSFLTFFSSFQVLEFVFLLR